MHLTVLIVCKGVLLEALVHDFISDYHLVRAVRLHDKLQDIQQLAGIAAGETQYGGGLTQFYVTLLKYAVSPYGPVQ